jgi:outer membrane lipoprotein-sorting protein
MGGAEKLSLVKDTIHVMEITLEPAAGGYKLTQISRYIAPNHFRQEQETPFGKIVVYSDGTTGWMTTPQATISLSTGVLATVRGVLFRQPTALMLSDRDSSRSVQAIGQNEIAVSSAEQRVEVEFSPETGLPLQQSYVTVAEDGSRVAKIETFDDWRDIDGIWFPFKAVLFENGAKVLEIRVSEYRFNTGLTPAALSGR